eukprot:scaffold90506_cov63-Phaeocystis_antarctica.AAC.1
MVFVLRAQTAEANFGHHGAGGALPPPSQPPALSVSVWFTPQVHRPQLKWLASFCMLNCVGAVDSSRRGL